MRSVTILIVVFFSSRAVALDPEACSAAAKEIDDRIAAGNHAQQNVVIATQLRDSLEQSCPFLDETTLAGILQGLDQLLPNGDSGSVAPQQTEAERKAEREAQRVEAAERSAERDKRRAAAQARKDAEQNLISDVARKPPTARSAKGQFMTRPDKNWGVSIVDWDIYESRARLLYEAWPSLEQWKLPDAARHFYVVEFDRNDNIVQHHIVETKFGGTVTAGLIRGRDEIILQWHEARTDGGKPVESNLERWSISKATMLSRSPVPKLKGPDGVLGPDNHFQLVTADGDLLYAASISLELGSGPTAKSGVSWMLASPSGEVRDQGLVERDDETVLSSNWFHSVDGSAGLILDITAAGENGIDSQLKPDAHQIGSASVRPVVVSERRLYVVGGTETGANLPAFARQLLWIGLENVDQSTMLSGESTRLMDEAEGKYRVRDSVVSQSVAGRNRKVVAPSGDGHAVLVTNNHRDGELPPRHGLWLQEFVTAKPRRDTYLNPDAHYLKAQFKMLASDGGNDLYVAGAKYVMRLNGEREVSAYAESGANAGVVKAIVADGNSIWLFGENSGIGVSQRQVWVERIQF